MKRCLKTPSILEYNDSFEKALEPVLNLAQRGQHVLTRRDILRYIASDANTRAREIQELLNITEIENIRSGLVRVRTHFKSKCEASENLIENSKGRIISITRHGKYSMSNILQFVNEKRILLKGESIEELNSSKIKVNLSPPILLPQDETVNLSRLESDVDVISELLLVKHQKKFKNQI